MKQHISNLWSGILQHFVEFSNILVDNFTSTSKYYDTVLTFFIREDGIRFLTYTMDFCTLVELKYIFVTSVMNKNAPGDGNKFLTQLMLLSITRNGITLQKFKTPMAFFTVYWVNMSPPDLVSWMPGRAHLGFFPWPPPSFHSSSVIYICMQYVLTIHFWGGRAGPPGLSLEQNIPLCMSSTVHTPPASFSPFLFPESLSTGPLGPLGRSRVTFHYPSLPAQLHPRGRAVFLMLSPSSHPLSHLRSQLPRIQLGSVEDSPSLPFAPSQGTGTTLSQKQRIFPRNARSVYGSKSSGR